MVQLREGGFGMNEKVRKYLDEAKKKELLERDLCETVYYDEKDVTDEMKLKLQFDYSKNKYYENVPIEVSDEDFFKIMKIPKKKEERISDVFYTLGVLNFVSGFLAGIFIGQINAVYFEKFNWTSAFVVWITAFVSGMLFIGFGKVIELLNDIRNK